MSLRIARCASPISHVMVYKGHLKNPLLGPYPDNITKRIKMFEILNQYRHSMNRRPWKVSAIAGEDLIDTLAKYNPEETLFVVPAGQSTTLDKVFSAAQTTFLKDWFFYKGGRGYFTCGSAYWVSSTRNYNGLCTEQPEQRKTIIKSSQLPLFQGTAKGPLCPFPGKKYQVGFYSDAVTVWDGNKDCTIYLSGGGSFIPDLSQKEQTRVLVRYLPRELERHGKNREWENAVILTSYGRGAALLSMFHPYYGPSDINVELYEKMFPDCGTDWKKVHKSLSPLDHRMNFVLESMLNPLEDRDFLYT